MQARLSQERDVFDLLDKAASCANEAQSLLQSVCSQSYTEIN